MSRLALCAPLRIEASALRRGLAAVVRGAQAAPQRLLLNAQRRED